MRKIATILIVVVCIIATFGITYYVLDFIKTNEIQNLTTSYENEINNLNSVINSLPQEGINILNLVIDNLTEQTGYKIDLEEIDITNNITNVSATLYFDYTGQGYKGCLGYNYELIKSVEDWIIVSRELNKIC